MGKKKKKSLEQRGAGSRTENKGNTCHKYLLRAYSMLFGVLSSSEKPKKVAKHCRHREEVTRGRLAGRVAARMEAASSLSGRWKCGDLVTDPEADTRLFEASPDPSASSELGL